MISIRNFFAKEIALIACLVSAVPLLADSTPPENDGNGQQWSVWIQELPEIAPWALVRPVDLDGDRDEDLVTVRVMGTHAIIDLFKHSEDAYKVTTHDAWAEFELAGELLTARTAAGMRIVIPGVDSGALFITAGSDSSWAEKSVAGADEPGEWVAMREFMAPDEGGLGVAILRQTQVGPSVELMIDQGDMVDVQVLPLPDQGLTSLNLLVADVDQDGLDDLVVLARQDEKLIASTFLSPTVRQEEPLVTEMPWAGEELAGAEIGADGDLVLVADQQVSVWKFEDPFGWTPLSSHPVSVETDTRLVIGDFDGDGISDIAALSPGDGSTSLGVVLAAASGPSQEIALEKVPLPPGLVLEADPPRTHGGSRSVGDEIYYRGTLSVNDSSVRVLIRLSASLLPHLGGTGGSTFSDFFLSSLIAPECQAMGFTEEPVPAGGGGPQGGFLESTTYSYDLCFYCPPGVGYCGWRWISGNGQVLTVHPEDVQLGPGVLMITQTDFVFRSVSQDTNVSLAMEARRYTSPWARIGQWTLPVEDVPTPPPSGPALSVSETRLDYGDVDREYSHRRTEVSNSGPNGDLEFSVDLQSPIFSYKVVLNGGWTNDRILSPGEALDISFTLHANTQLVQQNCTVDPADPNYYLCQETARIRSAVRTVNILLTARVANPSHLEINGVDSRFTHTLDYDFGTVVFGQPAEYDLVLRAVGGVTDLWVSPRSVTSSSPWLISLSGFSDACPNLTGFRLAPGQSCRIRVVFSGFGSHNLSNQHSDKELRFNTSRTTEYLIARLTAFVPPLPFLHVSTGGWSDDSIDFGLASPGDSMMRVLTLRNDGDPGSRLVGYVTSHGPAAFLTTPEPFHFDLGLNETALVPVFFEPQTFDEFQGHLFLHHNDVVTNGMAEISDVVSNEVQLYGSTFRVRLIVRTFVPHPSWSVPGTSMVLQGNNRWFSATSGTSRTTQILEVDIHDGRVLYEASETGYSQEVLGGGPATGPIGPGGTFGPRLRIDSGCVSQNAAALNGIGLINVQFTGACEDPIATSLSDMDFDLQVQIGSSVTPTVIVHGSHDGFPAYEVWYQINGATPVRAYGHEPGIGYSPSHLAWPMDVSF